MAPDVFDKIDTEIANVEAEISAAQARLAKLRSAREVLAEIRHGASPEAYSARRAPANRRISLRDHIEERIRAQGQCVRGDLFQRLLASGVVTTEAALATTLTRMKARGLVNNRAGVWDVAS